MARRDFFDFDCNSADVLFRFRLTPVDSFSEAIANSISENFERKKSKINQIEIKTNIYEHKPSGDMFLALMLSSRWHNF